MKTPWRTLTPAALASMAALCLAALCLTAFPHAAQADEAGPGLDCKGQEGTLTCLQQQATVIDQAMQVIYQSMLHDLSEDSAKALQAEQEHWARERDQTCVPRGYVHDSEDVQVCRIRMTLARVTLAGQLTAVERGFSRMSQSKKLVRKFTSGKDKPLG